MFSFFKKLFSNTSNFYRNSDGEIECPGMDCIYEKCTDECPIHLNTQAIKLIGAGKTDEAIQMYEKAVALAPDFKDAWNNMGTCFGMQGKHSRALECYSKAYSLDPKYMKALMGMIIANRDLKNYDEALWLYYEYEDKYFANTALKYELLRLQREEKTEAEKQQEKGQSQKPEVDQRHEKQEVENKVSTTGAVNKEHPLQQGPNPSTAPGPDVNASPSYHYVVENGKYFIYEGEQLLRTPGGKKVYVSDKALAERFILDLTRYGKDYHSASSILAWHYTWLDNFSPMPHVDLENLMADSFLKKTDWTCAEDWSEEWRHVFGTWPERMKAIKVWLSNASRMQITAACCIGNAYESLNVSYAVARIVEAYEGPEKEEELKKIARMIADTYSYGPFNQIYEDFKTFDLYYIPHLQVNGPAFRDTLPKAEDASDSKKEPDKPSSDKRTLSDDNKSQSAMGLNKEELYGKAWLLLARQNRQAEGLQIMRELDQAGFIEGTIALSMFTMDKSEKMQLVKKAADAGNSEGEWEYCALLPHSYCPDPQNPADAEWEKYCLAAAEGGCADAMNEMGNIFNRRKHYTESMYWYAMANANGQKDGALSMSGIAKKWTDSGKNRDFIPGSPRFNKARHACAIAYLEIHSESDISVHMHDIIKFSVTGEPIAAYLAGDIYEAQGNDKMAYTAYNAVAFTEDPHGLKCLADMLITGRGVEEDVKAAMKLYAMAAEKGERSAMFIMGEFNRETNRNIAAYWYGMAHTRGFEHAFPRLRQMALSS